MITRDRALAHHAKGRPGKLKVVPSGATATLEDLSLAYTPGVAEPCLEIARDPDEAFRYDFGPNDIIPKPFDRRVLLYVAPAAACAAMESGVARPLLGPGRVRKTSGPNGRRHRHPVSSESRH